MNLRYFAWVRTQIGCAEEEITTDAKIETVEDLLQWLSTRGPGYARALQRPEAIRVAVNHNYVDRDHVLQAEDEVALFPPMTGG